MLLAVPASANAAQSCGTQIRTSGTSIPNGNHFGTSDSIYILPGGDLSDVDVTVNLTHPDDIDLGISVSHAGVTVPLSSGNGGSGENYRGTVFDDESMTDITQGSAPFTGSFNPEKPLTAFDGTASGGIWTLHVTDDAGTSDGGGGGGPEPPQKIDSWGLKVDSTQCPAAAPVCDEAVHSAGSPIGDMNSQVTDGLQTTGKGTIDKVEARFTIHHTADDQLDISLGVPGTTVDLSSGNGGAGDNYIDTVFDDAATTAITAGSPPFTGHFTPEHPLSAFNGGPANKSWSISVGDDSDPSNIGSWESYGLLVHTTGCVDPDGDSVYSAIDNCPDVANPGQSNYDRFKDADGDPCDADDDQDGVPDTADRCPTGAIDPAPDYDTDGCNDAEDLDDDDDGVADGVDACAMGDRGTDPDLDGDGCRAGEDPDDDADGVLDPADACAQGAVGIASDHDGDGCSDAEDPNDDNDALPDAADRCPAGTVGAALDHDDDGCSDAEDLDVDDDGVANAADRCPAGAVGAGVDRDGDGCSDALAEDTDDDDDGVLDAADSCRVLSGPAPLGCPLAARKLKLGVKRLRHGIRFSGRLTSTAAPKCVRGRRIVVRRAKRGKDPRVGRPLKTSSRGKFSLRRGAATPGRYYAVAPAVTLKDVARCRAASSKRARLRRG